MVLCVTPITVDIHLRIHIVIRQNYTAIATAAAVAIADAVVMDSVTN